ncbi:MAG: pyridoxamine 5'-phosphate oxidase [Planctomycetes bacterium]|jgi:pyridoxamine 5'-phosphate oxidase|nr:pyridoxamine 5'-phosphate oxidase [Planctomycetota bacterium]
MSTEGFSHLRVEYGDVPLARTDLPPDPFDLFRRWLQEAAAAGVNEPNGMALATVDADGQPHCRILLLKTLDARGFTFFTNQHSAKGGQLDANPRAAATFWWPRPRNRQVRITGTTELVEPEVADAYFQSRPRRAQLCSAASPQSRVVADRDELERRVDALARTVGDGPVPRPAHWGGYRLVPAAIEFWQGRDGRLHDRFRFRREGVGWAVDRLAP